MVKEKPPLSLPGLDVLLAMIRPDGSEIPLEYDSLDDLKSSECERGGLSLRTG